MKFTDKATLNGPGKIDDNGFLRLNKVRFGRIGIQKYLGKELPSHLGFQDSEVVNVFRPEEEVFAEESLATLQGVPAVIKDHEWKTPDNNNSSGSVSGVPERDGNDVVGQMLITDRKAIELIKSKKLSDISLGYQADVEKASGVFDGVPYQASLKNIRINHVAILRPGGGRAGDKIKIEDRKTMDLITIDTGAHGEIEVSPKSKAAVKSLMDACAVSREEGKKLQDSNKELTTKIEDLDKVKAELEDAKKELEKKKGELKAKDAELEKAEDPEELEKKAKEMNDALTVGKAIMGDKLPKGLTTSKLKLAIAKHYADEKGIVADSEKPSDDYMMGIYGVAASKIGDNKTVPGHKVLDRGTVSTARSSFMKELQGGKK
jgi:hypothetical protein